MSDYSDHFDWLIKWYKTSAGKRLIELEAYLFRNELNKRYSPYILQVGGLGWEELYMADYAGNFTVATPIRIDTDARQLLCELHQLPIESDSVDLVIIPHSLELSSHPMPIIEEAERVLKPEGRLLISGFTPRSMMGGGRLLLNTYKHSFPLSVRFVTQFQVTQWLQLLSFASVEKIAMHEGLWPLLQALIRGEYHPQLWASYMIKATKRRYNMHPLRLQWKQKTNLKQPGLINIPLRKMTDDD